MLVLMLCRSCKTCRSLVLKTALPCRVDASEHICESCPVCTLSRAGNPSLGSSPSLSCRCPQPDVSFDAVEALQPVPRLVYGLLRSPVLTQAPDHHPDLHTALRLLWTALPPEELRRAVYPLLSSYTTPDVQARVQWSCACVLMLTWTAVPIHARR